MVAALCLLLVILLASCSQGDPVTPAEPLAPVANGEGQVTTLLLWHAWGPAERQALALIVERYNRVQTAVQVVPQAMPLPALGEELRAAVQAGGGPHLVILQSHTLGTLAESGLLLPLDDLIGRDALSQLLPTAVGSARLQDTSGDTLLFGVPLAFDTLVLYYNRANLEVAPDDTDALLRSARGLTDTSSDPPVWGLAYTLSLDKTIGYLYAFEGRIFDEAGAVVLDTSGRAGTERWLQWLLELRQDERILAVTDSIAVDSALKAQSALMTVDWAHAQPGYRALWGENLGVAPLPRLSETGNLPQPYVQSDVISINARLTGAAEQQAALDFINYLTGSAAQAALLDAGKQPVRLRLDLPAAELAPYNLRDFQTQARQGLPMPNSNLSNYVVRDILDQMQLSVVRGLATPADAVTQAADSLRARLHTQNDP